MYQNMYPFIYINEPCSYCYFHFHVLYNKKPEDIQLDFPNALLNIVHSQVPHFLGPSFAVCGNRLGVVGLRANGWKMVRAMIPLIRSVS